MNSNKKVGRAIFYLHKENSNKLQTTVETQEELSKIKKTESTEKNCTEEVKTESKHESSIYLSKQFENRTEILDISKQMFDCQNTLAVPSTLQTQQNLLEGVAGAMEIVIQNQFKNTCGAGVKIDKIHVERELIFNEDDMLKLFKARCEDIKTGRAPNLGKKHP